MCHDADSHPPPLPAELRRPIAGGAGPELLELRSADGATFSAAYAGAGERGASGVVILPDVRGLHGFYIELAERFAQAGHDAIAIDYFGRTAGLGPRGDDFDAMAHTRQTTVEQIQLDIAAATAAMRDRGDAAATVTVGFCFGGLQSLLAGTRTDLGLAGVVAFYGGLDASRFGISGPLERAAEIAVPVLGLYGDADPGIPVEQVHEFERRLEQAGVPHEIEIYAGAPHSFFDRRYEQYADASADAWRRVLGFLEQRAAAVTAA